MFQLQSLPSSLSFGLSEDEESFGCLYVCWFSDEAQLLWECGIKTLGLEVCGDTERKTEKDLHPWSQRTENIRGNTSRICVCWGGLAETTQNAFSLTWQMMCADLRFVWGFAVNHTLNHTPSGNHCTFQRLARLLWKHNLPRKLFVQKILCASPCVVTCYQGLFVLPLLRQTLRIIQLRTYWGSKRDYCFFPHQSTHNTL